MEAHLDSFKSLRIACSRRHFYYVLRSEPKIPYQESVSTVRHQILSKPYGPLGWWYFHHHRRLRGIQYPFPATKTPSAFLLTISGVCRTSLGNWADFYGEQHHAFASHYGHPRREHGKCRREKKVDTSFSSTNRIVRTEREQNAQRVHTGNQRACTRCRLA